MTSTTHPFTRFFLQRHWRGRPYLISPFVDFMAAGGAALLTLPLLFAFFPSNEEDLTYAQILWVSSIFATLEYVVNNPHFMVSYQLLYDNFRRKISAVNDSAVMRWRYIRAGIIVPVFMLCYFLYAYTSSDESLFGYAIHAMYFFVGWHYVKQAFGVFIVLSAMKGIIYGRIARAVLLTNSYIVWLYSWVSGSVGIPGVDDSTYEEWGIEYTTLTLPIPDYITQLLYGLFILYGVMSALAILLTWRHNRVRPSSTALSGYATMYMLYILSYSHALWIYFTPLFHSLQYLIFVFALKRGQTIEALKNNHTPTTVPNLFRHNRRFILLAFFFGILSFTLLPVSIEGATEGMRYFFPALFTFSVFINIHHYFIDNVIWRKENADVGHYLFK